ncbi:MAG: Response regulator of zinc sigma-54-dependent two-component system [Polyangiaceae bacterium]|jgi:DNA-binding NtrC family response regulator|nr:Response regulator of zinc sigma-54-dependent two-component system [Polyangiaceae bacterium]
MRALVVSRSTSSGASGFRVAVLNAPASPSERRVDRGAILLGADAGSDIVVTAPSVSRRHVQLCVDERGVELLDLGSRNGTYLEGKKVQRALLQGESNVRLGDVKVLVAPLPTQIESQPDAHGFDEILGEAPLMRRLIVTLGRLRGSSVPLLLEGESGTGKEVVARAAHVSSSAPAAPFVAVNCAAMDRALARSELFGHRRGAFTGAIEARAGAFELAHGGTLFLDEINGLPLDVQPLLLRALETERVSRMGDSQERTVKVRLIAASNRPLAREVAEGRFRDDLFYRLNVVRLVLPPLRERGDDIPLLAQHFAKSFGMEPLAEETLDDLRSYAWPGNVRELRNVLRGYAAIGVLPNLSSASELGYTELLRRVLDPEKPYHEQKERLLGEFIDVYLAMLLERTGGNQSEASRLSGLDRAHLNKMVTRLKRSGTTLNDELTQVPPSHADVGHQPKLRPRGRAGAE